MILNLLELLNRECNEPVLKIILHFFSASQKLNITQTVSAICFDFSNVINLVRALLCETRKGVVTFVMRYQILSKTFGKRFF